MSHLLLSPPVSGEQFTSAEDLVASVSRIKPADLQRAALRTLGGPQTTEDGETGLPSAEEIRQLLAALHHDDGALSPLSPDRWAMLLQEPEELQKRFVAWLQTLWESGLRDRWSQTLPALEYAVQQAQERLRGKDAFTAFEAVTGRPAPEWLAPQLAQARRVTFYPVPFLGPYIALHADFDQNLVRVGYGVGLGERQFVDSSSPAVLPGGLLAALSALADESRLQILAELTARTPACAQDLITALGLSQSAVSRHLRVLESTGILSMEWIDGVKRYRVNMRQVTLITQTLIEFLGRGVAKA